MTFFECRLNKAELLSLSRAFQKTGIIPDRHTDKTTKTTTQSSAKPLKPRNAKGVPKKGEIPQRAATLADIDFSVFNAKLSPKDLVRLRATSKVVRAAVPTPQVTDSLRVVESMKRAAKAFFAHDHQLVRSINVLRFMCQYQYQDKGWDAPSTVHHLAFEARFFNPRRMNGSSTSPNDSVLVAYGASNVNQFMYGKENLNNRPEVINNDVRAALLKRADPMFTVKPRQGTNATILEGDGNTRTMVKALDMFHGLVRDFSTKLEPVRDTAVNFSGTHNMLKHSRAIATLWCKDIETLYGAFNC